MRLLGSSGAVTERVAGRLRLVSESSDRSWKRPYTVQRGASAPARRGRIGLREPEPAPNRSHRGDAGATGLGDLGVWPGGIPADLEPEDRVAAQIGAGLVTAVGGSLLEGLLGGALAAADQAET